MLKDRRFCGGWPILVALLSIGGCGGEEEDWPPELESLFDPVTQACVVPACDESGNPGIDPNGTWRRTLTTIASDCPELVAAFDERAVIGNVDVTDPYSIDHVIGTCHYKNDIHVGTVKRATFAECTRTVQELDVISFESGVAAFDDNSGQGQVRVYLRNLPGNGADCQVDLNVFYQRKP